MASLKEMINYWLVSARKNFSAVKDLYKTKHYVECLFWCHLVMEKLLKGLILKYKKTTPLPIHDLLKLARDSGLKFSESQLTLLAEINEFNIRARYDNIKFQFYKRATKEFTKKYLQKIEELYLWLIKKF